MRTPPSVPPVPRRPGLTLIELIVVLMILIALAGLLVPMLPSMLTRAHDSSCATTIGDVNRAVQTYQSLNNTYPNNWDALSDGTKIIDYFANGTALPATYGGPGTAATMAGGEISDSTPAANELAALNSAGIFTVQLMKQTAPNDPTFDYYASATPTSTKIATGTHLAFLDPANNASALRKCIKLNLSQTGRYVVLGVGPRCDLVGKMMQSAPVHFGDTPVLNPEYGYVRFCAIFKVSDTAIPNFSSAVLVGSGPVMDDGIGTIDDHLQDWYQKTNGG